MDAPDQALTAEKLLRRGGRPPHHVITSLKYANTHGPRSLTGYHASNKPSAATLPAAP